MNIVIAFVGGIIIGLICKWYCVGRHLPQHLHRYVTAIAGVIYAIFLYLICERMDIR